jgi:hypothetical protein
MSAHNSAINAHTVPLFFSSFSNKSTSYLSLCTLRKK